MAVLLLARVRHNYRAAGSLVERLPGDFAVGADEGIAAKSGSVGLALRSELLAVGALGGGGGGDVGKLVEERHCCSKCGAEACGP